MFLCGELYAALKRRSSTVPRRSVCAPSQNVSCGLVARRSRFLHSAVAFAPVSVGTTIFWGAFAPAPVGVTRFVEGVLKPYCPMEPLRCSRLP
jgi:hypothetical protein